MRIAYVSTHPPIECGIGTYTAYLNKGVKSQNNETFVISQVGAAGDNVFPIFHPGDDHCASQVFMVGDRLTPDVVHIQFEFGLYGTQNGVQAVEMIIRFRMIGVPVVVTLHTVKPEFPEDESIVLQNIAANASAVIVHEEYFKEMLVNNVGHADKIHVIAHGIREMEPVANAKKLVGVEGKKVIAMCGYYRPTKGFHKLVEWLPEISAACPQAHLLIAGKLRNSLLRNYQAELFEKINQSPAKENMLVMRGQFPQHTFDTLLSSADLVCLPYDVGAQSGVMAHCFAMNKPVVCSDLPAFKNMVNNSGGGIACSTKDDYIKAITQILTDDALRDKMKASIKGFIKEKAGWSKIAQQHVAAYQSLIKVPYKESRHFYNPE